MNNSERNKKAEEFLKENPNETWAAFTQKTGIKMSDSHYYSIRRKISGGKRAYNRSSGQPVYIQILTLPSAEINPAAKDFICKFIDSFNAVKNTHIEALENIETKQLEIREKTLR